MRHPGAGRGAGSRSRRPRPAGSAQTGSGKTVAYGLALAETLLDGAETLGPAGEPLALIIAPTRELAMQVQRELSWLYHYAGARVVACVGGMDPGAERRAAGRAASISWSARRAACAIIWNAAR